MKLTDKEMAVRFANALHDKLGKLYQKNARISLQENSGAARNRHSRIKLNDKIREAEACHGMALKM